MQIKRRELLAMLATGLAGCQPEETPDGIRQTSDEMTTAASTTLPPVVATTQPAPTTTVPVRIIEVIERAAWGAAAAKAGMEGHVVERLTIHHTGVALEDNREAPARLRAHQVFHQTDRDWPDLAYHFAIDRNGNIYEGRAPELRGDTATSYDPTGHFLVVLEGNFDVEPTAEAQLGSLRHLLAWAASRYSVGAGTIQSHRDYAPGETSCPGDNLYPLVESGELARAVSSLVTEEVVELIYLRGEEAIARVASIEAP